MAEKEVLDQLRRDKDLLPLKPAAQLLVAQVRVLDLLNENGHSFGIRSRPDGPSHQASLLLLVLVTSGV